MLHVTKEMIELEADFMIEDDLSIDQIAEEMQYSASTVYNHIRYDLKNINRRKHRKCEKIRKLHRWNRAGSLR